MCCYDKTMNVPSHTKIVDEVRGHPDLLRCPARGQPGGHEGGGWDLALGKG